MTDGTIAAITAAISTVAFVAIVLGSTDPSHATIARVIAVTVPVVILLTGIVGLVWDRWGVTRRGGNMR
jgi:hypothetical protein